MGGPASLSAFLYTLLPNAAYTYTLTLTYTNTAAFRAAPAAVAV